MNVPEQWRRSDNGIVRSGFERALRVSAFFVTVLLSAKAPQVTIEDSGSTNRAGIHVTFDREGHASVEQRGAEPRHIELREEMCKQFMCDLEAVGALSSLPTRHCMKSVSFGSSLFVEFNGDRSPDLNCPGNDPRTGALRKDAKEILQEAREAAGIKSRRMVPATLPRSPNQ